MDQCRDSRSVLEPHEASLFRFAGYIGSLLGQDGACRILREVEHEIRSTRIEAPDDEGGIEAIWLSEELALLKSSFRSEVVFNSPIVGIDWLRFRLALTGNFASGGDDKNSGVRTKFCELLYLPENSVQHEIISPDKGLSFVDIFCSRRQFFDLVGNDIAGLPVDICQILHGFPTHIVQHPIHMTPTMERMVDEMLRAPKKVAMKPLFYRFKTLALLYELITGVRSEKGTNSGLGEKESASIISAYEVLLKNYITPPSLETLARKVGVNCTFLAQGFKDLFGVSIGEFCLELRMERGWHLLSRSSLPVNEIAHQLGYEHTANFSTAIKRWFGQTPREIRQAGYR